MKYKFTKHLNKVFIIFILLVVTSPWFWAVAKNRQIIFSEKIQLISLGDQVFIGEINTFRGEALKQGIPPLLAKLAVNKLSFYSLDIAKRYFETFDSQYLFFTGDINVHKSTRAVGSLHLFLLPAIIFGILVSLKRKDKLLPLLAILALPASFVQAHYETVSRIPVLVTLLFLASLGLTDMYRQKRQLFWVTSIFLLFEFLRFVHDFINHYPGRLI